MNQTSLDQSDQLELSEIPIPQIYNRNLLNPESISNSLKQQQIQVRSSPNESINAESFSFNPEPPHNIAQNVTSDSESYLNISFQEILSLIFNNECPQLVETLKQVFQNSLKLINILAIFIIITMITEVIGFYISIISEDNLKQLFSSYFGFKLLSDSLFTYILCQIRYTIIEANQINIGDVSHPIIEYLKHTIKINSPLDEAYVDEMQSQAQQVANIIASKISTFKWLNYLIEYQNSHMFAMSRVNTLSKILLFIWGNATLIQWMYDNWEIEESIQHSIILLSLTLFSMLSGYLIILGLLCIVLLVCAGIPVLICLVVWQSCSWFQNIYQQVKNHCILVQRQRFLDSLIGQTYQHFKSQNIQTEDECSICLQTYEIHELCVALPCNVESTNGIINHLFHEECIRIWIEECGSCPICRTRFVARID